MPYLILTVQRKNIYIRIRYIYIQLVDTSIIKMRDKMTSGTHRWN